MLAYNPYAHPDDRTSYPIIALRRKASELSTSNKRPVFTSPFHPMLEVAWSWYSSWIPWINQNSDLRIYAFQLIEQAPESRQGMFCYCLIRCLVCETYRAGKADLTHTTMYELLKSVFRDEKAWTLATSEKLRRLMDLAEKSPGKGFLREMEMVAEEKDSEEEENRDAGDEESSGDSPAPRSATYRAFVMKRTGAPNSKNTKAPGRLEQTLSPPGSGSSSDSSLSTPILKAKTSRRITKPAAIIPESSSSPDTIQAESSPSSESDSLPESHHTCAHLTHNPYAALPVNTYNIHPQDPTLVTQPIRGTTQIPTFPWLIYNVLQRCGPILPLQTIHESIVAWCPGRLKDARPGDRKTAEETLNANIRHNLTISDRFVLVGKEGWRIARRGEVVLKGKGKGMKSEGLDDGEVLVGKQIESPPTTLERSPLGSCSSTLTLDESVEVRERAGIRRKRRLVAASAKLNSDGDDEHEIEDERDEPRMKRQRCGGK